MSDLSVLRRMPHAKAVQYARGLLSLLSFRPDLRRHYALGDLALIETLAGVGEPDHPDHYAKYDDQPRDSLGRWTVEGRADLAPTTKRLARYKDVDMDADDVWRAVTMWMHLQADHGSFSDHAIDEMAREAMEGERRLAALAWAADRAGRERAG